MKALTALNLLKKHKLCHPSLPLSLVKKHRRIVGAKTWEEYIKFVMMCEYLVGTKDHSKPIIIPEVGMGIGGTQILDLRTGKMRLE